MPPVEVETVIHPSWWAGATTLYVLAGGTGYNVAREDVELLPAGVAFPYPTGGQSVLFPWAQITRIETE